MAGSRIATGPMRNPTAEGTAARAETTWDGRWTAREPVGWRDDAGRGCREDGAAWNLARPGDATDSLAGGSAEHPGWHPAVAASGAGDGGGGRADRSVRGAVGPGGPGGRAGG